MDNLSPDKQTLRILFFASEPTDAGKLRLGKELEAVRGELAKNAAFEIKDRQAVKPEDVLKTILTYKPHIVHFSGHGQESGEICFEDDRGLSQAIAPIPLANLFKLSAEYVKCVIVNTCYSEKQVKAISEYVPIVIGTKKEISDDAAIRFSTAFYAALEPDLSPKSLKRAFEFGRTNIWLDNLPEHLTPLLIEGSPEVRFSSEVDNAFLSVAKPKGIVFDALKRGLTLTGKKMGVPEDVVSRILGEKVSKLELHSSGVMEYENTLKDILKDEYPLSDTSKLALLQLQYGLDLTEDEVRPIHERILNDNNVSSPETWYIRGRKQASVNNNEKAIEFYTTAIEKDDDYSGAYYERGYCFDILGNYAEGIRDFSKAIECNKKWEGANKSLAYYSRARCYHAMQTDDDSERYKNLMHSLDDWNMTLELDRNQSESYYGRGLVYAALNDPAKAVVDYKKAFELSTADERKRSFARSLANAYQKLGNVDDCLKWSELSKDEVSKLAVVDK